MKNKILVTLIFLLSCFCVIAEENTQDKLRKEMVTFGIRKDSIETYFAAADEANDEGYIKLLEKAVKLDPKNYIALDDLGVTYANESNNEKAKDYYKQSISINSKNPFPYVRLYEIYKADEDYESAEKIANDLTKYIPEHPEGYYELSNLYYMDEEYEKSIASIQIAIEKYKNLDTERFYEDAENRDSYLQDAYYLLASNYYALYQDKKVIDIYLSQLDVMKKIEYGRIDDFRKIAIDANESFKDSDKKYYEKNKKLLEAE